MPTFLDHDTHCPETPEPQLDAQESQGHRRANGPPSRLAAKSGPSYWLFKTEPEEHSWEMQKARGKKGEPWTGVRNFVARNNMKAMQLGDLGFFYHTGEDKQVVGIVEVCATRTPMPRTRQACGSASTCAPYATCPSP